MILKGVPFSGQTRHLAIRPAWALGRVGGTTKPTEVQVGGWNIYRMPVYSSDDQELFWHIHIPGRWDGVSDIAYQLFVALGGAEDVGDKFKFQLDWDWASLTAGGHLISATPAAQPTVETLVLTSRAAEYNLYRLDFTIDYDILTPKIPLAGEVLAGRVIRIASGSPAVAASPYIVDHVVNFTIDKAYKA
jgi:hypothetical protein